ncbi:MAG: hypothetical protein F9K22_10975 [Bacteroidetes bacterium]|nr:MAG: hypothetical protein F9K22_10975 [Bacteroidota bacterium]
MTTTITEIAVYTVPPEKAAAFAEARRAVHALLPSFDGFRSIRSLQSVASESTFADVCEWESRTAAEEANRRAMDTPEFRTFFELGTGMITFDHYRTAQETTKGVS